MHVCLLRVVCSFPTTLLSLLLGVIVGILYREQRTYVRSTNAFSSLSTPVWALNGTDTTVNLVPVAYTCLFANYNEYGTEVWYAGDLCGVMTIPAITGLCRLTQWTLFWPWH